MALFSAFALIGLALAAAGIYSVLSFHVLRRTHELGVRMALGAPRRHVLGLMLLMGGRLVLVGLVIGIGVSLASTRLLRSQLFGVQPADPLSYAAVAMVLVSVFAPRRRLLHSRAPRGRRRRSSWWRSDRSDRFRDSDRTWRSFARVEDPAIGQKRQSGCRFHKETSRHAWRAPASNALVVR
jgi:hypothetical protein